MGFIDDENFVSITSRAVTHVLPQLPHLIDAAVRGGVNLNHIDAFAGGNFFTACAFAAGLSRRTFDAVQATGDDASNRGFPRTSLAGKDVAMSDPFQRDRIGEGSANML